MKLKNYIFRLGHKTPATVYVGQLRLVQNCLYNRALPISFLIAAQKQTSSSITLT